MSTGEYFPGPDREADNSLPSCAEVKNGGSVAALTQNSL
jgi:hypothetical protein